MKKFPLNLKSGRTTQYTFQVKTISPFNILVYLLSSLFLFFFIKALTGTRNIAVALCVSVLIVPIQIERSRAFKFAHELAQTWPEVIDQLVSGIHSGLSLSESVMALSLRGPGVSRKVFSRITELHLSGTSFNDSMFALKEMCRSVEADLIAETLMIARNLGGRDIGIVLRMLGEYFRENLALREEIKAKHGWIKNSAVLASLAPWILLIILSTQESTRSTYATATGLLVLLSGAGLTVIAFIWMNIVGRIPEPPRVFSIREKSALEAVQS
jgi:tight adherence protein B